MMEENPWTITQYGVSEMTIVFFFISLFKLFFMFF